MMSKLCAPDLRRRSVHPPAILACFAAITCVYFSPLIANITTAIPGTPDDTDVATMVWNVGWVQRALNGGADLLRTDMVLIPFGADLRLHTYGLLQGLLAYPLASIVGVIGAFNLILMLTFFLNGLVGFVLIRRHVRQTYAALIAAVWLMFGVPLLVFIKTGRPSFGSLWIVCGALLALQAVLDDSASRNALALGLWLVMALVSDFQILLFTGLWLGLYLVYWLCRHSGSIGRQRSKALAVAAFVLGVPFFAIYFPVLAGAEAAGYARIPLKDMLVYSFRFWDYVQPDTIRYVYGWELLAGMLSALLVFRWRGSYRFWLGGTALFLLLALGPFLQPWRIPLPFAAITLITPLQQFRTPARLAAPALIGAAITTGYVLAAALRRIPSHAFAAGVVAVAVAARLWLAMAQDPFAVQVFPTYDFYSTLASEPGDFSLLEVPFEVRSGLEQVGRAGAVLEIYQHAHGKPILNGMIARLPAAVFQSYRSHPVLLFLGGETVSASASELDRDLREVIGWSRARYVLLHRSLVPAGRLTEIERFLDQHVSLTRSGSEKDLVIYAVR